MTVKERLATLIATFTEKEKELEVSLIAIKTESSVEPGGRSITLKHVMGQTVESFGHPPLKN